MTKRMITAIFADDEVPAGLAGGDVAATVVGVLEVGVAEGDEMVAGALYKNVNVPVTGASVALSKVYVTV